MTTATPDRLLAKMLRDHDPVSQFAAADMLEERGREGEAAKVRRRAERVAKVAGIVREVNSYVGKIKARFVRVEGRLNLCIGGGEKQLCLFVVRDDDGRRVSQIQQPARRSLRRDGHLYRRCAELVDSLREVE